MQFLWSEISPCYREPSRRERNQLLSDLKNSHQLGILKLRLNSVMKNERVPWRALDRGLDCHVDYFNSDGMFYDQKPISQFGSCTSRDILSGSAHAASEALERTFTSLGGQKGIRPGSHFSYDVSNKTWIDLGFNALSEADPKSSVGFAKVGEAFHVDRAEALRASLCELVERLTLVALEEGRAQVKDITGLARKTCPLVPVAESLLKQRGFSIRFFWVKSDFDACTIVCYIISERTDSFPEAYRGSACDLTSDRAIEQSLDEAGRSMFLGTGVSISERSLAEEQLTMMSPNDYEFGLLTRMLDATDIRALAQDASVACHVPRTSPTKLILEFPENSRKLANLAKRGRIGPSLTKRWLPNDFSMLPSRRETLS